MARFEKHTTHCDRFGCGGCECSPDCDYWGEQNFADGAEHQRRQTVAMIRRMNDHTTHSELCLKMHQFAKRLLEQLGEDYDAG